MTEDVLNAVLEKIDSLNKNVLENKEASSKVMLYLANKNKELEKLIMTLRNDMDAVIEAENSSYNEIEALKKEINKVKSMVTERDNKIKELETKLNEQKEANEKSDKSFDLVNKTLFNSIEQIRKEQKNHNDGINNLANEIKIINDKFNEALTNTESYILIDRNKKEMSKFRKFFYKIFHYRQLQELERQKAEEERIRQQKIQEELERKRKEEEERRLEQERIEAEKIKQNREKIKNILNTAKPNAKPKK